MGRSDPASSAGAWRGLPMEAPASMAFSMEGSARSPGLGAISLSARYST